ncbi:MAG: hypothetical protein HFE78_05775 [Clostridiales bacterium]|nr:hypothetical protein [Clostridiales bacterium]
MGEHMNNIETTAKSVELINNQLRTDLFTKDGKTQEKKLWENTFIKHQIDRRKSGDTFSISDHIRAMVYSLLSSGIVWDRIENEIDLPTGKILSVDEIFHQYEPEYILESDPAYLRDEIKKIGCVSQYTMKQMQALIDVNIPKLITFEHQYGGIDKLYKRFIDIDKSLKTLTLVLSHENSGYKMAQMGVALICEYLKNVGYEIAKPDRHICRILGSEYLALSGKKSVPPYEAIDIIAEMARTLNKSAAEVDYILWSYCASGYGEVCTVNKPKCDICVAKEYCNFSKKEL